MFWIKGINHHWNYCVCVCVCVCVC